MPHPASISFLDRLAADLLAIDGELRPLMRRLHYDTATRWPNNTGPLTTAAATFGPGITVSGNEARTLLRAAMPFPLSTRHRRGPHASVIAALATFAGELQSLTIQPAGNHAIAAALDLIAAVRQWVEVARWHEATAAASVQWKRSPPLSITAVTRQRTSPDDPALFSDEPTPAETDGRKLRTRAARLRRAAAQPEPVQRTILLPIAGKQAATIEHQAPDQAPDQAPHQVANQVANQATRRARRHAA